MSIDFSVVTEISIDITKDEFILKISFKRSMVPSNYNPFPGMSLLHRLRWPFAQYLVRKKGNPASICWALWVPFSNLPTAVSMPSNWNISQRHKVIIQLLYLWFCVYFETFGWRVSIILFKPAKSRVNAKQLKYFSKASCYNVVAILTVLCAFWNTWLKSFN